MVVGCARGSRQRDARRASRSRETVASSARVVERIAPSVVRAGEVRRIARDIARERRGIRLNYIGIRARRRRWSMTTTTTTMASSRGDADAMGDGGDSPRRVIAELRLAMREREVEIAELREEVRASRARHAAREEEFRRELRAMAAQCASLAATSSAAAAVASSVAVGVPGAAARGAAANERGARGGREATREGESPQPRRQQPAVRKPPTAWEVPNAWPPKESSVLATQARERAIEEENANRAERERRQRLARRQQHKDAFVGDLSAFFFKTARHEAPVWATKSEKTDAFASEVLDAAQRMHEYDDDSMFHDVEDSTREDPLRPARMSDTFEYPPAFSRPSGLSIEVPRNDDEEEIPDIGDEDGDLVTALLEGGEQGERAAEILAERLRAVGFDFHEPAHGAL